MDHKRKIIHIDMDAFYASVDQRDFPELRGRPLAVGGSPDGRGVVATASYEARKFGVKSAMPSRQALQLCPHLTFTRPRFDVYKQVSQQIREIFRRYTDIIEPLSLDEAFLDVSTDKKGIGSALDIAHEIKKAIQEELQLTASAGISVNKFIAKIASDQNKPNGLTFIGPSKIHAFLGALPIERFFGVGKVTASKMRQLNIHTGADLKKYDEQTLVHLFGKTGHYFYNMARGIDDREVQPNRETKSLSVEDTFGEDLQERDIIIEELDRIADRLNKRLKIRNLSGKTLTLKIKFNDFTQITRSLSAPYVFSDKALIHRTACTLLDRVDLHNKKIRLLGITISNFTQIELMQQAIQLKLFEDEDTSHKH